MQYIGTFIDLYLLYLIYKNNYDLITHFMSVT